MCLCQRCKLSEDSSYLSGSKPLTMSRTLAKPSNFPLFLLYTLSKEREFTEVFFLLGSILVLCQPQGQACWQPDISPLCYLWITFPLCTQMASFFPGKVIRCVFIPCNCFPDPIGTLLFLGRFQSP